MKFVSSVAVSALGLVLSACSATTPGVSSAGPGGSHPGGATPGMGGGTGGSTGTGMPPKPDFGFTPPVTTAGGMSPDAKTCGEMAFNLQRSPAQILLVLDRSGSMADPAAGVMGSKWMNVTAALNETLTATDGTVQWGFKVFPQAMLERCAVADGVDVPIAPMNAMAIAGAITGVPPVNMGFATGATPTAVAVTKATDYLKSLPTTTPKYMVLATDGLPNCRNGVNGSDDATGAVAAVQAAAAAGFHTFVVGIATMNQPGADLTLNSMAMAGLEPRMADPKYYPVSSRADLVATLGLITGQVTNCVFPLTMAPPATGDVTVKVNGMVIPRDPAHAQGWDLAGNAVQVYGAVCDQLKGGAGDKVEIVFGCFIP
jgi:hypothetical protein